MTMRLNAFIYVHTYEWMDVHKIKINIIKATAPNNYSYKEKILPIESC